VSSLHYSDSMQFTVGLRGWLAPLLAILSMICENTTQYSTPNFTSDVESIPLSTHETHSAVVSSIGLDCAVFYVPANTV